MDYQSFRNIHETIQDEIPALPRSQSMPLPEMRGSDEMAKSEKFHVRHSFGPFERPKRVKSFDPEAVLPEIPSERPLRPPRNPPNDSLLDYIPFLRELKSNKPKDEQLLQTHARTTTGKKIRPKAADSNVPMEITLFLSTYFISLMRKELLTPASATAMNNAIIALQDTVVNLERIKDTPLPFAYQAHLRMSVW